MPHGLREPAQPLFLQCCQLSQPFALRVQQGILQRLGLAGKVQGYDLQLVAALKFGAQWDS
jgi:hypothetical protein